MTKKTQKWFMSYTKVTHEYPNRRTYGHRVMPADEHPLELIYRWNSSPDRLATYVLLFYAPAPDDSITHAEEP